MLLQRICNVLCPSVFYGWTVVILVGLGMSCASPGHSFFFLNFVDSFISIGIPRTTVASLWSTCLVCAACTAPIGGNLIDRLGPRRILLVVSVPFCMAVAALGLVQNAPQLFGAIFIVRALGPGWINIAFNKIFNGWWEKKRGRAASVLGVFHNCALLFVPATRAVINAVGWREAYGTFALVCFCTLGFVLLNVRDRADALGLHTDGESYHRRLSVADSDAKRDPKNLPACHRVFRQACRTAFFPVYLIVSFTMEVAWGGLNFHINEIFAEAGLDADAVAISYTIMTFAGIVTGLVVGNLIVDRMQRKSLCVAFATVASGLASALLVVSIDGAVGRWVTVVGFGVSLGMMSGFWEICYGILLADVFGLEILGTITGTLSTFGLSAHTHSVVQYSTAIERARHTLQLTFVRVLRYCAVGMAIGPVALSLSYEAHGGTFRYPLLLLASANFVGAFVMACVPYKSREVTERDDIDRHGTDDDDEQLGLLINPT